MPSRTAEGETARPIKLDGQRALLALPGGPFTAAAVVVAAEPEVDRSTTSLAVALARAGHAAVAIGCTEGLASPPFRAVRERINRALARLDAEAATPLVRVGAVGVGPGGFDAVVAGYHCRVSVAFSIYGEGAARVRGSLTSLIDRPKRFAAPLLFLVGSEDTAAAPADLAGIRERLETFGMRHSFLIYPRAGRDFLRPGAVGLEEVAAADARLRIVAALSTGPRLRGRPSLRRT